MESEDSTRASTSLSVHIHDPFLDANVIPSDETDPEERSLYQAKGVFSQSSTQPDERYGEHVPTMSTPDLSFTASSSPCRFATRESPSLHAAGCESLRQRNVAPFSEATFSHSSFVHRLDNLLRRAADQQFQTKIGENVRIQLDFPEAIPRSVSRMASIAYDEVTASELGPAEHDSRLLALSLRQPQRSSSFVGDLSDDNTLAIESYDAGHDSRRNKRKDSYFSASDVASPAQSPCPDVLCPPFKKRKSLSLNVSPLFPVSRADSPVVSDTNLIPPEPLSVRKNRGSDYNATHYASKGVQYPSPSHSLSQDEQDFKSLDPSNALSACESDVSYPQTEISTSPLGLGPVPIPDLRNIPEADIPRIFWSNEDAAEARLMSLLRKEARYYQTEEWLDVFLDPDLALKDNLGPDVIAWILTVSAIFTQSSYALLTFSRNAGRTTIWISDSFIHQGEGTFP